MTTNPRALIAEARRHDEAMTSGPWSECCHGQPETHPCRLIWGAIDGEMIGSLVLHDGRPPKADVAGIAWLRSNLSALLEGYTSALDEIERLNAQPVRLFDHLAAERMADEIAVLVQRKFIDSRSPAADALLDYRDPPQTERSERIVDMERDLVAALTSIGEQALVIEQQDRDLERLRAALIWLRSDLLDWSGTTPVNLARVNALAAIDQALNPEPDALGSMVTDSDRLRSALTALRHEVACGPNPGRTHPAREDRRYDRSTMSDGVTGFTVPNVSIAGAPTIDWNFTGSVGRAEIAGAKAYAEAIDDTRADLRITDATGEVLADVVVRKMDADDSITVSVMNIGTALLWSHMRWLEANKEAPCAGATAPEMKP